MTEFGYTMMSEQAGPKQLVADVVAAEQAGFDFAVISDHYFPWLDAQGHSSYAWSVLGGAALATDRLPLMTYVTCPIIRYHPVIVAQAAATVQLLSDGRFTLGLGSGENLNEHVVGGGWPSVDVRHRMLREAIEIIRGLFAGEYLTYDGQFFDADSAKIWDLPETPPAVGVAVSGPQSCQLAGELADAMMAVEPSSELGEAFDAAGGTGKPRIGQVPVCFDRDEEAAVARAHEQFRWFAGGWKVNAELPGTAAFDSASQFVRPDDVAEEIPCGADVQRAVEAVRPYVDAGFTHVALLQVGGDHQGEFIRWANQELLPALRSL
ncbi:MAG TPA: LLM class F420-dependent oxidoreductase [Acidimicrobiales bacterium]|nr:LLM class F420-dependent oxidoreductase [Acidimicrobiales bacterium]